MAPSRGVVTRPSGAPVRVVADVVTRSIRSTAVHEVVPLVWREQIRAAARTLGGLALNHSMGGLGLGARVRRAGRHVVVAVEGVIARIVGLALGSGIAAVGARELVLAAAGRVAADGVVVAHLDVVAGARVHLVVTAPARRALGGVAVAHDEVVAVSAGHVVVLAAG